MTVIDKVGEYVTADGSKATVEYTNDQWAFGYVLGEREKYICTWFKLNGDVQRHHGGRLDIVAPYAPSRKRWEGTLHVDEKGNRVDPLSVKKWYRIEAREIDTKAEKEAREILEEIMKGNDTAESVRLRLICSGIHRALSLLLPDAALLPTENKDGKV